MDDIAELIVDKWKKIIESYSIEVESVSCFRMNKYYKGYPEIEYCYKVSFDFGLSDINEKENFCEKNKKDRLMKELELNFIDRFQPVLVGEISKSGDSNKTFFGTFHNDKVDYFTNQGHRIIIQFYPQGFITELREDKLNQLGI